MIRFKPDVLGLPRGALPNSIFSLVCVCVCVPVVRTSDYFIFRSIECWCVLTFRLAPLHGGGDGGGGVHHCRLESTWYVWYIFDNRERRAYGWVQSITIPDLSMFVRQLA